MTTWADRFRSPSARWWVAWHLTAAAALVVLLTLHYTTHGTSHGDSHALFRRLSYLPIAALAVSGGVGRGAGIGAIVALAYAPHAFFAERLGQSLGLHLHGDPAPLFEKASDVVVYVLLGALVGFGAERTRIAERALVVVKGSLAAAEKELLRAERLRSLGEMAAGIAHEIRNPLTALRTTAEVLAEAYPVGHARHRMAALHLSELDRLDQTVQSFLAFARPPTLRHESVDARQLVGRATHLAAPAARARGVVLHEASPRGSVTVVADPDQITQVLLNVTLNAIQASPRGGTVDVSVLEVGDEVHFRISDQGAGVDASLGERIFEPCVTTRAEGTGLGLSVSSRIVHAHGGAIRFSPRDGGGTEFVVALAREQQR